MGTIQDDFHKQDTVRECVSIYRLLEEIVDDGGQFSAALCSLLQSTPTHCTVRTCDCKKPTKNLVLEPCKYCGFASRPLPPYTLHVTSLA